MSADQTEDRLDTRRRLECIPTTQAEEAKRLLEGKSSIVIKGNAGEGKTTMALCLIDNEMYSDRRVMLFSPTHWEKVDTDWVDIVILEDIFGQFDLDSGRLQEWMIHLPTIQEHVDAGKLRVIITTRLDILSKACSRIGSLKLFSDDLSLMLSSEQLNNSEKMNILNRELLRHKRNMKEDEKQKCITNFNGLIGFPQCCSLFAGDSNLFCRGSDFFRYSAKLLVANITALEDTRFLSLAFLFCNGEISEEYLTPETMPEYSKHLLMELASHLHISGAYITLLRDAYENFVELYVVKSMSSNFSDKPCVRFTHSTVLEAVGQVLGDRCLQMVVKYGDSEYIYQRTYTAEAKDTASENMFIPVSVYGLLAKRMVDDVADEGLASSVVKHSALKQHAFLVKLKDELHKGNRIKDFFTAGPCSVSEFGQDLSEGECITFMQYILQSDEDVVRLVYSHFLEFLTCAHKNNSSDCWKCKEKQTLLELALYYHHSEIADKLIPMNTCYTYESLINAARHGDLRRVQDIIETLKRSQVFNPGCMEGKYALCRAFISGNQNLIELLLKEGIMLNTWHVVDAVQHGDINVLMKVVEHLKCHNKWHPYRGKDGAPRHLFISGMHLGNCKHFKFEIPCFTALQITYCTGKLDMTDYLLENEVKISLCMLSYVSQCSSQQAVARVIQDLKIVESWDPHCDDASKILEDLYGLKKYDVCDLLVQEGISLTMKNLIGVVDSESLESVKKAIQHLKDVDSWDPKSDDASKALEAAYRKKKNDVCDLLVQEEVPLTMKHIHQVALRSLDYMKTAVKLLKDVDNWDPKCEDASKALKNAYIAKKYDVCDLLVQEGVSLTMKYLPGVVYSVSFKSFVKAILHLKSTGSWDPKCDDASKALENACRKQKHDMYDLLIQEGVSLTMNNLPGLVCKVITSYKSVEKAIQNLKDTDSWNPECAYASKALENAYREEKNDICDLLIQEGVSITMNNLPGVVVYSVLLETVEKVLELLKDTDNWNPSCDDASQALQTAYNQKRYDVCELLVKERIPMTMKHNDQLLLSSMDSLETIVKLLKAIDKWDPKSDNASEALKNAYRLQKYHMCDLLVQEGVSLKMKNLRSMTAYHVSSVKKAIQHLQDTDSWDPACYDASKALETAYVFPNYKVCALLVQEGVSLTVEQFTAVKPFIQLTGATDYEGVQQILGNLCVEMVIKYSNPEYLYQRTYTAETKDGTSQNMFIPVSAYGLLAKRMVDDITNGGLARSVVKHSVLNRHDFVVKLKDELHKSNRIKDFLMAKSFSASTFCHDLPEGTCITFMQYILQNDEDVVRLVYSQFLEILACAHDNNISDCWKCKEKKDLLELALYYNHFDIADELIAMKACYTYASIMNAARHNDLSRLHTIIKTLKGSRGFNIGCMEVKDALFKAYILGNVSLIELLLKEGIILNSWYVVDAVQHGEMNVLMKVVEHLKCQNKWNPHREDDGIPRYLFFIDLHLYHDTYFQRQIPCFKALQVAYCNEKFNMTDYLQKNEAKVSLCLLSCVSQYGSQKSVAKVIEDLKVTDIWDPHCDDASKVLENAYILNNYDVCDLLVQERVLLAMKNMVRVVDSGSLLSVKKAIQHLRDADNWNPKCDDASKALEAAYRQKKYDVCDLLVQEGVSLTMKQIHQVILTSLDYVKAIVKLLKDVDNWDSKSDDASKALANAYIAQQYDVCDLLVQEGVSLTMKYLPGVVCSVLAVEKAIQHLKDTGNWDPKCDEASKALETAYRKKIYAVCDLLVKEGISLKMKHLPGLVWGFVTSYELVKTAMKHLKATDSWDHTCDDASKALMSAYRDQKYDVCDLLVQEGVTLTMKYLSGVVYSVSAVTKAIQHLKDTYNWDPKSDDASKALEMAYILRKYDVCDLLVLEGVSLNNETRPFCGIQCICC